MGLHGTQTLPRQIEPNGKEQKDDAQFAQRRKPLAFRDQGKTVRSDQRADEKIAQNRTCAEPVEERHHGNRRDQEHNHFPEMGHRNTVRRHLHCRFRQRFPVHTPPHQSQARASRQNSANVAGSADSHIILAFFRLQSYMPSRRTGASPAKIARTGINMRSGCRVYRIGETRILLRLIQRVRVDARRA